MSIPKIVAALPVWGTTVMERGLEPLVRSAERAGIDGLWIGDHLVLSKRDLDAYPYESFFLSTDEAWLEAIVTLTHVAGLATRGEIGLGVALAAVRPPVELARQTATLTHFLKPEQSLAVGVSTGWMQAEYEAMGVDFATRGRTLDTSIDLIRECWSGAPTPGEYGKFSIPPETYTHPAPRHRIPIIIAGDAAPALRRVVARGDGWLGPLGPWDWDSTDATATLVSTAVQSIGLICADNDRDLATLELSISAGIPRSVIQDSRGSEKFAALVMHLASLGISRVVLTLGWRDIDETAGFLSAAFDQLDPAKSRAE